MNCGWSTLVVAASSRAKVIEIRTPIEIPIIKNNLSQIYDVEKYYELK